MCVPAVRLFSPLNLYHLLDETRNNGKCSPNVRLLEQKIQARLQTPAVSITTALTIDVFYIYFHIYLCCSLSVMNLAL